jgi:uncharacterized protein
VTPPARTAGAGRWPHDHLDVPALRARGWRPTALREFVLKVHQRCNLACDYCYMYTMADQTWRDRPRVMPPLVWRAAARRIAEHARRHALTEVSVVLHGGEPLLAGAGRLVAVADTVRAALPDGVRARVGLQTNAVLLDEPTLQLLLEHDIRVGVSLDGDDADHDRHRRHGDGRGSAAQVRRGLRLLASPPYDVLFSGLLCTIDPRTDPVACYEALLAHRPPMVDFLLPHANWEQPPAPGAIGPWLVRLFDRWYGAPREETRIRLLEAILALVLGGASRSEQVGLSPVALAVVETDGAIEQVDALKSAYPGAAATGLSVLTDPFDAALDHPGFVARQLGLAALGPECARCAVHRICGGGHYVHRYRAGAGFRNPSVYCADLMRIIDHIRGRITADIAHLTRKVPA